MNSLEPGYGETPLPFDELEMLLPHVRQELGEPVSKALIYELEQAYEDAVREAFVRRAAEGEFSVADLLTDWWIRDLHARLYENIWLWAGTYRTVEVNIGVDPWLVATELRSALGNLLYRWERTDHWDAVQLALAVHAESVRIHPFVDGNGRTTRLLADLVLLAAQSEDVPPAVFDWAVDKSQYIRALRRFDVSRDPAELAGLVQLSVLPESEGVDRSLG